jgi:hypothetical protein
MAKLCGMGVYGVERDVERGVERVWNVVERVARLQVPCR